MTEQEARAITNEKLRIDQYPFTVRPLSEADGGGFVIEYPDIPGCKSDGETPEEAVINGKDALRSVLLTMIEFGDPIPEPGSATRLSPELTELLQKRALAEGKSVESILATIVRDNLAA